MSDEPKIFLDTNILLDAAILQKADDFEDKLQYQSALNGGCDCIVTNNIKDFESFSKIPLYSSSDFTSLFKKK